MLALSYFRTYGTKMLRLCFMLLVGVLIGQFILINDAFAVNAVRISNLSDITVPLWVNGDPNIVQDVFACVYRQNTSGSVRTYGIKATGDGPGFLLKNGTKTLAYTVTWNDGGTANPGGGTTAVMVSGTKLTTRNNARIDTDTPTNSTDCNAGASPTARIRITITAANTDFFM